MNVLHIFTTLCVLSQLLIVVFHGGVVDAAPQEPAIEIPVELIGFPVIILAVRLSNFVRKLAYSLNPRTYMSRTRREIVDLNEGALDVSIIEKRLIEEFGKDVCIYEKVCTQNAIKARNDRGKLHEPPNWDDIFSVYEKSPNKTRDFYLLSVFLGDIVGSPQLCRHLAKREHRSCP